ncbi:hypothetical protein RHS04_08305 [Rhizoctonia solani]|uniref:Uncharacterized protein n=1 Tax=Rhizoctonia solani TaxID=456999 RepID=A0A8H7LJE5_9AGAM|nr:hypothetical protein RHS04_08305 [Rhizoctonia solani]
MYILRINPLINNPPHRSLLHPLPSLARKSPTATTNDESARLRPSRDLLYKASISPFKVRTAEAEYHASREGKESSIATGKGMESNEDTTRCPSSSSTRWLYTDNALRLQIRVLPARNKERQHLKRRIIQGSTLSSPAQPWPHPFISRPRLATLASLFSQNTTSQSRSLTTSHLDSNLGGGDRSSLHFPVHHNNYTGLPPPPLSPPHRHRNFRIHQSDALRARRYQRRGRTGRGSSLEYEGGGEGMRGRLIDDRPPPPLALDLTFVHFYSHPLTHSHSYARPSAFYFLSSTSFSHFTRGDLHPGQVL